MVSPEQPGAGVVWARVEEGFHVGSRSGVFLGYIDRQPDGVYLAHDGRSRVVGRFTELTEAMATVTNAQPPHDAPVTLEQVRVPARRSTDDGSAVA
ncbi:hypothetical protein QE410_000090 [Microbacterium sp. SORGH_AS 1204]|uniref:hypothetical protein n=1 Tax=Microbacterium sp. SORGH_AS_1204 TaxID=3041785 RepID=UPI002790012C|nr:hypothetical protein [Microbacterium sp. SORGH_AS_1204]MDQ1135291.1 hypothetical protein [Microbacterium sp. SORGH_AS_1204]